MDHRLRRMGQRPDARATVSGAVFENLSADVDRGDREVPRLGDDPWHWPRLREEARSSFGETVFDTIEVEPDRLREVAGIGPVRAKQVVDAWAEQKVVREIMMFLHSNAIVLLRRSIAFCLL
jgi:hypothetical protein